MSENEVPAAPEPQATTDGPVLAAAPRWVPAAIVAGAVLCVEGLIVSRIRPETASDVPSAVTDAGGVAFLLGALSLIGGYFAFLLSRVSFARALEALALTALTLFSYLGGMWVLLAALNGNASTIVGISDLGLTGRGAAMGAIAAVVICVAVFAVALKWWTAIVWPRFRGAVALNVLAMLHLVVVLLGVVSFLNVRFVPGWTWATVDLTETGQYSLSEKTRGVLDKVDGELLVFSVDYGAARRNRSGVFSRVQELLRQYQAACPKMTFRTMDALRSEDDLRKAFLEAGVDSLIDGLTGEEDVVVFGYRPTGEKLVVRTRIVRANQEFADTSAFGSERFKGEGILTNAIHEVVFAERRVAFLEGHGEKPSQASGAPVQSVAVFAEALRGDNFSVSRLNLSKDAAVPGDVDLVVIAGPSSPLSGAEAEALSAHLARGGSVLLMIDPLTSGDSLTGLEGILQSHGISAPRDFIIVSYMVESTVQQGDIGTPTFEVFASRDEFGRHPAMAALRGSTFVVATRATLPVFKAERVPEGVEVQELLYAPREIRSYRPFAAKIRPGRFQKKGLQPEAGDITDKRMPLGVTAERKADGSKAPGRLIVFGDSDFAADVKLDTNSPGHVSGNRNLLLNVVSWAVRRDLIAIDPKSVETEIVQLRPLDRDLAFWTMVVGLPILVLGVAVGMWWVRRR